MDSQTRKIIDTNAEMFELLFGGKMPLATMKATQIDPACPTPEFEHDVKLETKDLLCRDRIMELEDVDVEVLMKLYADHNTDTCDLGEVFHRYMKGIAANQAYENIKAEYE